MWIGKVTPRVVSEAAFGLSYVAFSSRFHDGACRSVQHGSRKGPFRADEGQTLTNSEPLERTVVKRSNGGPPGIPCDLIGASES